MKNLYLPVACFMIELLLIGVFFLKKTIKNEETKLYKFMIFSSLIDIIISLFIFGIAYTVPNAEDLDIIVWLNKIDFIYYIFWPTFMFLYILYISIENNKDLYAPLKKILFVFDIAISLLSLFLEVKPYNVDGEMSVFGSAATLVYAVAILYIIGMIVLLIVNYRKILSKKYIPFYILVAFMIFAVIIRQYHPTLIIIPSILVYVNLIMYFTIENPDAKLVEYEKTEKERAEAASLAKSEFLSSMSHELRTPLNAIVGLSEDIDSYKDKVPEEVREDTKDIINASNTLLEIIGSILDISKIESGKLDIICGDYDPKEEFESVAKINRTKFAEKNLTFNVQISDNIPEVLFGDRLRIKQIINNFLSNAYKYSDSGTVDYIVNWLDASGSLQIIVKDQGRGIKPEDIGKLFGKYDRLGVEKESNVQGTGLGLNITKTLIDMMGGKVEVQSEYLVGSTFTVTLPQKIGSKEELERIRKENARVVDKLDYRGKRLLVVDDNMLNIKVLKKAIKAFNFIVDECYNGKEALEKIEMNNNYDIVLMDILMPIMGGEEAIQCLRSMPNFHSPVVALTADAMTGAKEKYKEMGFDDYMAKPFTRDTIAKKLSGILGDGKEEKETKKKDNLENTATINVTINNYNVDCDNKK